MRLTYIRTLSLKRIIFLPVNVENIADIERHGLSNASLSCRCVVLNIHDMVKPCFISSAPSYIAESKSGGRLSFLSETIT